MARTLSITSPSEETEPLLQELKAVDQLLELKAYRGVSISPPGDSITLTVPNSSLHEVIVILDKYGLGKEKGISISTSEPASYIPTGSSSSLGRDSNDALWEEMEMTISNDSNTSINTLIIIFISGSLATIGIATNALHIVVGGMLVAPGFMPLIRISLGIVNGYSGWRYGLSDFFKGYLTLILGAVATSLVLRALGYPPSEGSESYYQLSQPLIDYWTTITAPSLLASAVASIAGALLVATKKSVFTSGVMIGLALVPSAALIGIGFVAGDLQLSLDAFYRFMCDVALVVLLSFPVFYWLKHKFHKRKSRM